MYADHHLSPILDQELLIHSLQELCQRDSDLARILAEFGPPPLWAREPGFPTLVQIILEQQVSLASAKATFDRLLAVVSPLTPEKFLELDDASLKQIGLSRQKALYTRHLAESIQSGSLDLAALQTMSDTAIKSQLLAIKGIGSWTADIYLLMALRRPDAWPSGDLALAVAVEKVKGLSTRPTFSELSEISEPWRPWRAVAARLLWHYYLNQRSRRQLVSPTKRKPT